MRNRKRSEKIDALSRVPLFSKLSKGDLGFIATLARGYMVEPERPLVVQREQSNDCLVILSGAARVEIGGTTVAHLGPGDVVGEISLIDGKPRTATVVAEEWTEVLALENGAFKSVVRSSPSLQYKLLLALCSRLRDTDEFAVHWSTAGTPTEDKQQTSQPT